MSPTNEIQAGTPAVVAIEKAIELSGSAQFDMLENGFLRLRTMINRLNARFDWAWTVDAGVFNMVFLLALLLWVVKLVPWRMVVM